jgi:putative ABC transport system permease protein
MILTFVELQSMSLGFEPDRVITVTATQGNSGRTIESSLELERTLVANVAALPGVEAAGVVFPVPMNGVYDRSAEFAHAGMEEDPAAWSRAYFRTVSPTYFDSVGLTVRAGRGITRADADPEARTVVIDERLAAQHFRGANPIGERIRVRGMRPDADLYEIVGVVEYAPQWDHRDRQPTMYFHRVQYMSAEISVMARVAGDPAAAARMVLDTVRTTAPELPADLAPLSRFVDEALSPTRFVLVLLTAFAGMALLLATVGLYAVLAYGVRRQTREIGIRMALGAEDGALVRRVVGDGTLMAAVGAGLGLIAWSTVGRLLESQLYGVGTMDPRALAATAVVLIAVAALASWVPARRAARVDPAQALRADR